MSRIRLLRARLERIQRRFTSSDEGVAAWVLSSYKGDAKFLVNNELPVGGLAKDFLGGVRAHFIMDSFMKKIADRISEIRGEVSVSIDSQRLARTLWKKDPEKFLKELYAAHNNGAVLFGARSEIIDGWLRKNLPAKSLDGPRN